MAANESGQIGKRAGWKGGWISGVVMSKATPNWPFSFFFLPANMPQTSEEGMVVDEGEVN